MKGCKYFLPCGHCDKYNIPCKSTSDGIIDYNLIIGEIDSHMAEEMKAKLEEVREECKHDWIYDCRITDLQGTVERHHCKLCGEIKTVEIKGI